MPPKRRKDRDLIDSFDVDLNSPPRHRIRTVFHNAPSGRSTQTSNIVQSLSPIKCNQVSASGLTSITNLPSCLPTYSSVQDTFEGYVGPDIFNVHMSDMTQPSIPCQPTSPHQEVDSYVVQMVPKRRQKSAASTDPLKLWRDHADKFLDELLRSEGRGDYGRDGACMECGEIEESGLLRCQECFGGHLLCRSCTVHEHRRLPLHRIEIWTNDSYFKPVSLKELGLFIQLGPHARSTCPNPMISHQAFCVIHLNGIHEVQTFFCGCVHSELERVQLLRVGWYPATVKDPKTVFTFTLLRHFHIQTLQSKIATYDFYTGLVRETDNTGVHKDKARYYSFMRVVRQWRHLLMMKRAGRGHQISGIHGTSDGELAVQCPACPIPNVNLSDGWEKTVKELEQAQYLDLIFLHTIFVALDANFRLKRKMVSSDIRDPSLAPGKAYFVPPETYKKHINVANTVEVSTCTRLNAVTKTNTRETANLAVTGVGGCICARHMFMRPNGVGDLQKGERYVNMDFIFFSAIITLIGSLTSIFVSYDIACQWSKNIRKRAEHLPESFDADTAIPMLTFLIPKFHLPGHGSPCQAPYSFNLNIGCARTDGEGIERGWSFMNPVGTATREMGPGNRQDTLEDHWGNMNWTRTVDLYSSMDKKLVRAIPELLRHQHQFESFCDSLSASLVVEWTKIVADWEADHSKPDPYMSQTPGLKQADVRKELAAEEDNAALSGFVALHEVTPTVFLVTGLELEDMQARLKTDLANNSFNTSVQLAKLQERRTALRRQIDNWQAIQTTYMPAITTIRSEDRRDDKAIHPENIPLHLPFSLTPSLRVTGCIQGIAEKEWRLRHAQAEEALTHLRQSLCLRAHMVNYKRRNEVGQRANTRANSLINANVLRTRSHADRYRRAYKAMLALDSERDNWRQSLFILHDNDIVPLQSDLYDLEEKQVSGNVAEGYRTVSWLWRVPGTRHDTSTPMNNIQEGMHDALRIEWARGRARAMRWREEVMLLCEEMRRCIRYFKWKARWWEEQQGLRPEVHEFLQEGMSAYALEHALLFWDMGKRCERRWLPFIKVAEHTLTETTPQVRAVDEFSIDSFAHPQPIATKGCRDDKGLDDSEWNGLRMVGDEEDGDLVLLLPAIVDREDSSGEDSVSDQDDNLSDYGDGDK